MSLIRIIDDKMRNTNQVLLALLKTVSKRKMCQCVGYTNNMTAK